MKVRTLALALAILGSSVAVQQRLSASPADEALARGRAHVEQTCLGCHAGPGLDAVVEKRRDPKDRNALDAFLATHHVPDPALRRDVVDYLETRRAAASERS